MGKSGFFTTFVKIKIALLFVLGKRKKNEMRLLLSFQRSNFVHVHQKQLS